MSTAVRVVGMPAGHPGEAVLELAAAVQASRPAFLWCDGEDVIAVLGESGDTVEDVLRVVGRTVPEVL